jgi:hypothetical protein
MKNKKTLISEMERIKEIIGVQLITEGVAAKSIDDALDYIVKKIPRDPNGFTNPVNNAINSLKGKINTAISQGTSIQIGNVIDDLVTIASRGDNAMIIGSELQKVYPEVGDIVNAWVRNNKEKVGTLSDSQLRTELENVLIQHYTPSVGNLPGALNIYKKGWKIMLNDQYLLRLREIESLGKTIVTKLSPDAMDLWWTLIKNRMTTADALQKQFKNVSEQALRKMEQPTDLSNPYAMTENIMPELKEMFAIMASSKKKFSHQPVLDEWFKGTFFQSNPQLRQKFESFVANSESGYKELNDLLMSNTNSKLMSKKSFEEWLKRYRSIWPFKIPPKGSWNIFNTDIDFARVAGFILTKRAASLMDINRYLIQHGTSEGSRKLVMTQVLLIFVIFPLLESWYYAGLQWTENTLNDIRPDNWDRFDFVDRVDNVAEQYTKILTGSEKLGALVGGAYNLFDLITYANDVGEFIYKWFFGGDPPGEQTKQYKKRAKAQAAAFGPDVQYIIEHGKVPPGAKTNVKDTPIRVTSTNSKTTA